MNCHHHATRSRLGRALRALTAIWLLAHVGSAAGQTSFDIGAYVEQNFQLSADDIDEIYAVEQRAALLLIAAEVVIPIVTEPKQGYLLVLNASTGLWERLEIDSAAWNADLKPALTALGVEVHQQPPDTVGSVSPSQEALEITLFASVGGLRVANLILDRQTVRYEYDALGRLTKVEYVDQVVTKDFAYDSAGNRTQVEVTDGGTSP